MASWGGLASPTHHPPKKLGCPLLFMAHTTLRCMSGSSFKKELPGARLPLLFAAHASYKEQQGSCTLFLKELPSMQQGTHTHPASLCSHAGCRAAGALRLAVPSVAIRAAKSSRVGPFCVWLQVGLALGKQERVLGGLSPPAPSNLTFLITES